MQPLVGLQPERLVLRQDVFDDMPRHIGQAVIATAVPVCETLVVDPHQVRIVA